MSSVLLLKPRVPDPALLSDNIVLRHLPPLVLQEVICAGQTVRLTRGSLLCKAGEQITSVYFPENSICSTVWSFKNGQKVQVSTSGREGIVGLESALGNKVSSADLYCHTDGAAVKIAVGDFQALCASHKQLHQACLHYATKYINQLSIERACRLQHSIEQRCALWLLTTSMRCNVSNFFLTQEGLAEMLGVSRTRVSAATSKLARHNLIRSCRGKLTIFDQQRLAGMSCSCLESLSSMFSLPDVGYF